jgi:hypothetical protein
VVADDLAVMLKRLVLASGAPTRVRTIGPRTLGGSWPAEGALLGMYALRVSSGAPPAEAATYDGDHRCSRWVRTR